MYRIWDIYLYLTHILSLKFITWYMSWGSMAQQLSDKLDQKARNPHKWDCLIDSYLYWLPQDLAQMLQIDGW